MHFEGDVPTVPEQALYLKWRPMTFEDVVGQEHITHTLRSSLKTGRVRHAYLFSGPRGTGKTTTARLLAKAINCHEADYDLRPCNTCAACLAVNEGRYLDLIEIDAATHTGVDDVRDLRDKIAFTPGEGRFKVYIIDEVHRFSGSAFDALLKTLEEPPAHALFVLATTDIEKVPQTIKSRCLQFEFRRISLMQVADRLEKIANGEGLNIDRAALELIARQGTGSARDSISLLDQIVADPTEHITLEVAQRILGTANSRAVGELVEALLTQNVALGLHILNTAIDTGSDPKQFGQQVIEHLRNVMLAQTASTSLIEASDEERELYAQQAEYITRNALLRAIRLFNEAVNTFKGGWQPQLALELALIDSVRAPEPEPVAYAAPAAGGVMLSQTAAPRPAESTAEPDIEPTAPGTPPLIPVAAILERWEDMLRAVLRYSSTAPGVLQYYRVQRVDGNTVYLATTDSLYFSRLHGQPEKLKVIEKALRDVHRERVRVQVVLVENFDHMSEGGGEVKKSSKKLPDNPLLAAARELGADIREDGGES